MSPVNKIEKFLYIILKTNELLFNTFSFIISLLFGHNTCIFKFFSKLILFPSSKVIILIFLLLAIFVKSSNCFESFG